MTDPETVPAPTLAELARSLLARGGHSTLATQSFKHPGFPFASVVPYAVNDRGEPIFLISRLAVHTRNLEHDPRATLLVADRSITDNPLAAPRVAVMGQVQTIDAEDLDQARQIYLAQHPEAASFAQFGDFQWYRMSVVDAYIVGGFGVMGWIRPDDFERAQPDSTT
ncbi:MAG: pyridoxamine 5'-phosphate oxidase family protein [Pirellulales bacterium]